jgi:hypothetical protein
MDQIELLPSQLARRNWVILALLLLGSLPFGNLALSLGILAGGLIAIGGFIALRSSLDRLLGQPTGGSRPSYLFGCFIRLAVLSIILGVLIAIVKIHVIGLVIGLSVVIINLLWMTAQRAL